MLPVEGDAGDPQHKRKALTEHFKAAPACEKALDR
jgi:hypothetical protein